MAAICLTVIIAYCAMFYMDNAFSSNGIGLIFIIH
jgi:hypothetical protein